MKQYTGELKESIASLVRNSEATIKRILSMGLHGLGSPGDKVFTVEESIKRYNKGLTKAQITAWVWYRKEKGVPMHNFKKYFIKKESKTKLNLLVKKGNLFVSARGLEPEPVFLYGNMYDRLLETEKQKDSIVKNHGQAVYDNHIDKINEAMPRKLTYANSSANDRPVILSISNEAYQIEVSKLNDNVGVILDRKMTLHDAYKEWLRTLPETKFHKTKAHEIISYYLQAESKPRNMEKIEWDGIKVHSKSEGEKLFSEFLHVGLTIEDILRVDMMWNRKFNGFSRLKHELIPVGFEHSKLIGPSTPFTLNDSQQEGVAYMDMVGSGIIAFDVGLGKTITAAVEIANALQNGKCKRPIIAVPNPTYKNWIKELFGDEDTQGVFSGLDITYNDWFNLGTDVLKKGIELEKKVPENSITFVTYEGLEKIGFGEQVETKLFEELGNILDQQSNHKSGSKKEEREREKNNEKYRDMLGKGLKNTIADIDELGFDYLVIDEAHNFKNVFANIKGQKETDDGKPVRRFNSGGGKPSDRAVKGFFLANYIQKNNRGGNVMFLTATPFNNQPIEIYSMLSMVGYNSLIDRGIKNINDFFMTYIDESSEYVVKQDGSIKLAPVVKAFNNRLSLQRLIRNHILFKTGEEANIPRPCKLSIPRVKAKNNTGKIVKLDPKEQILSFLSPTGDGETNQIYINSEASKGASKDDPGRLLRLMTDSRKNAFSPYFYDKTAPSTITPVDFVENSPKIQYTMECIRSIKEFHEKRKEPLSGQVIYSTMGKEYFPLIKEYLIKELGYKEKVKAYTDGTNPRIKVDEVEILDSKVSKTKKEHIKNAFLNGQCKIIIGTSSIREGINLQKKGTALFNLWPDWNPTDLRQLEGRIWRQKNEFGYVRIVMPLVENSMDIFMFQKLEEKTSRLNDLWSTEERGNVFEEDSLDPNEVKYALITDIEVLTRFELGLVQEDATRDLEIAKANFVAISEFTDNYEKYKFQKKEIQSELPHLIKKLENNKLFTVAHPQYYSGKSVYLTINEEDYEVLSATNKGRIDSARKLHKEAKELLNEGVEDDKTIINIYNRIYRATGIYSHWDFTQYKESYVRYIKTEKSLLEPRGYTINDDLLKIVDEFEKDVEKNEKYIEHLKSDEYYNKLSKQVTEKKKALAVKGGDLWSRVDDFAKTNNLLSYHFQDIDFQNCDVPTIELKPHTHDNIKSPGKEDKAKRIRIAKAKVKVLKLKLKLAQSKKTA